MLNKKVAALTLAAVISNFSAATTNVLAHEITQNVKTIATAKSDNKTETKSDKSQAEQATESQESNSAKTGEAQEQRTFTLAQNGNTSSKARDNLRMTYFGTDYQSTGIVARPGEEFTVYVEADNGAPMPKIAFSQHEGFYSNWVRWYDLKPQKRNKSSRNLRQLMEQQNSKRWGSILTKQIHTTTARNSSSCYNRRWRNFPNIQRR